MIRDKFKIWVDRNNHSLADLSTEYIKHTNPECSVPDPSTGIINESKRCLGQVIVWESRQMEFEILHIETEESILWKYIERLPDEPNFDEILADYFQVMQTGKKLKNGRTI